MPEKFLKNTVYIVVGTLLAMFLLIQPYNLFCKIKQVCKPIILSSLALHKNGQQKTTISFVAKIGNDLQNIIEFKPEKSAIEVQNGKTIYNNFIAQNLTDKNIIIASHFKVDPEEMGKYLERIECLCFQNQPLSANQKKLMPVSFRINPDIEKDPQLQNLQTITISYQPYLVE
jgi:cytochrome c oxidase assembly protein subunit 11